MSPRTKSKLINNEIFQGRKLKKAYQTEFKVIWSHHKQIIWSASGTLSPSAAFQMETSSKSEKIFAPFPVEWIDFPIFDHCLTFWSNDHKIDGTSINIVAT